MLASKISTKIDTRLIIGALGLTVVLAMLSGCIGLGPVTPVDNQTQTNQSGVPGNLSADTIKFLKLFGMEVKKVTDIGDLFLVNATKSGKDLALYITKDEKLVIPVESTKKINWTNIENDSVNYVKTLVKPGVGVSYEGIGKGYGLEQVNMSLSYMGRTMEFPLLLAMNRSIVLPIALSTGIFNAPNTEKPTVDLYVMSFCPFGQQAEKGLIPVIELLGDKINAKLHFVIYPSSFYQNRNVSKYCIGDYCSMHGINEVREDVRQMCIQEIYPEKFWDYVKKIDATCSLATIEDCWRGVADSLDINTTKIENCFNENATSYLAKEMQLNQDYGVTGSPTLFINGLLWDIGLRSPEAFKYAVCTGFENPPEECNETLDNSVSSGGSCG